MKIILKNIKTEEKDSEKKVVAEEKEYQIPYVSSLAFLEYLEIEEDIEDLETLKPNEIKKLSALIVKTFKNQFTEEEFFEGVPGYLLMKTINTFIGALNTDPYANKRTATAEENDGGQEKKAD